MLVGRANAATSYLLIAIKSLSWPYIFRGQLLIPRSVSSRRSRERSESQTPAEVSASRISAAAALRSLRPVSVGLPRFAISSISSHYS